MKFYYRACRWIGVVIAELGGALYLHGQNGLPNDRWFEKRVRGHD